MYYGPGPNVIKTPANALQILEAGFGNKREIIAGAAPFVYYEDFVGDLVPDEWASVDNTTTGAPTVGIVDASTLAKAGGWYSILMTNSDEAQDVALTWGNNLLIPTDKSFIAQFRFDIPVMPVSTTEALFVGLQNDLDSDVYSTGGVFGWSDAEATKINMGLQIDYAGAGKIVTDDGTNAYVSAAISGVTFAANTPYTLTIALRAGKDIGFYLNQEPIGVSTRAVGGGFNDASAIATTQGGPLLQPVFWLARSNSGGTGTETAFKAELDLVKILSERR